MINWCYVYLSKVKKERSSFLSNVPVRTANLLKGDAIIHVVYIGKLDRKIFENENIKCHQYDGFFNVVPYLRYLGLSFFLIRLSKEYRFDVVQNVWKHYFLFPIYLASFFCDFKLVARVAGVPISRKYQKNLFSWLRKKIVLLIERASLHCADKIQVLSNSLKEEFEQRINNPSKIVVIPQGVNTDLFPYKERNIPIDPLKVLYVGRISMEKGIADLIEAVGNLESKLISNIKITLIGECLDKTKEQLQRKISQLDIDDIVEWKGYIIQDELKNYYHSYSLLILPSRTEGLPNVILEGMASGIPCLGTAVGEIPYLLGENRGILVNPNDFKDLQDKFCMVLENEIDFRRMIQNSYHFINREHSFNVVKQKYLDLLNIL